MSIRDILAVVFRRKGQILATLFLCVAATAILSLLMTPKFEAESQILIKVGRENVYIPTISQASPIVTEDREAQINSEVQILTSRYLAEKLIDAIDPLVLYPGLKPEPPGMLGSLFPKDEAIDPAVGIREAAVQQFRKDLGVEVAKKSSVIILRFRHSDPVTAAKVLNTLDSLYLEQHLNVYQSSQAYKFFDEQAQIFDRKLREAEAALQAFKSDNRIFSPEEERELVLKQEAELQTLFYATKSGESDTSARSALHRQQLGSTPQTLTLEEATEFNPHVINTLQAKLVELELRAHELGDQAPRENIQDQIDLTRDRLRKEEERRFTNRRVGLNTVYQSLQDEMLKSEAAAQALRAKSEIETTQLAEVRNRLDNLNRLEVEFNRLNEEVEINRENYRLYVAKREESRVSQAMDAERIANVSVIDPAQPPSQPVSPNVTLNLLLSMLLGTLAAFSIAFVAEYLDNRLHTAESAEKALGLPLLGTLPMLSFSEFPDVRLRQAKDVEAALQLTVLASTPRMT